MSSLVVRRRLRARRHYKANGNGGSSALRIVLIAVLSLVLLGTLAFAAGIGTVFAVYQHYAQDYVPIEAKIRQSHIGLTEIYDRGGPDDGVFLGALSNPDAQLLEPVPLDEMSEWLIMATISTEDNSYWDHQGVNLRGLIRAAYENYILDEFGAGTGGSSITQQLVKNIYICPQFSDAEEFCPEAERTLDRKLREIAYAIELERDYTKEQILEWYLNQISYADRYVGIQAASQGYFRKDATELELHEAALLAGIPSSPSVYHPRTNCVVEDGTVDTCVTDSLGRTIVGGAAKSRQEDVLELMVRHGWISPQQAEDAMARDLRVYPVSNPIKAPEYLDNWVQPRLIRMCEAGMLPKIEGAKDCRASVTSAGYSVTTAIDWQATEDAIALIQERIPIGLDAGCNCHNASIVTVDPRTGEMTVYAPNRDGNNKTDPRVAGSIDQAVEIRQPGSAFKPLIYLAWFDSQKKNPVSTLWDTNNLPADGAVIRNPSAQGTEGLISAQQALGGSQNVPAFRAAYETGIDTVIEYAKKLGISTLDQHFDPTFRAHDEVGYGASIALGGANIRVADMAYMNSVFANMGEMVGVPHLARYIDRTELKSVEGSSPADQEVARAQAIDFQRGNIRLPGSRELDPIVVLEVRDARGEVLFRQGEPERRQVIDAGSVWLLNSIMTDCSVRLIIWGCGASNDDTRLDIFASGQRIPAGVKTGTQQGPLSSADTLATWVTGYTRYAATAVWVGNANNELIHDGPAYGFASAHVVLRLYKYWMGSYHEYMQANGNADEEFRGFDDLRPSSVTQANFESPATDRGRNGGCDQRLSTWIRTDVTYESECEEVEIDTRTGLLAGDNTPAQFREERKYVKLPTLGADLARELARRINAGNKRILIAPTQTSTGTPALSITSPTNGATITGDTDVVGSVGSADVIEWALSFGRGGDMSEIGSGSSGVSNSVLGRISVAGVAPGVYTLRLTATDALLGQLSISVQINISEAPPTPTPGTPDDESHPLGYELCGFDPSCGGVTPLVVRCGPLGWFADPNRQWAANDWERFVVQDARDAAARAALVCGG